MTLTMGGVVQISVNGMPLAGPMLEAMQRVVVQQNVYLPGSFEITFVDEVGMTGGTIMNNVAFGIGALVTIATIDTNSFIPTPPIPLIKGQVTSVEANFEDGAQQLTLRGFDNSYKLHHNRQVKAYQMMSDSLIVTQIAAGAGLVPMVTAGMTTMNEYVAQDNLTDWEFINMRAKRVGAQVGTDALGNLHFAPLGARTCLLPPVIGKYGDNLRKFTIRANMMGRATMVKATSMSNGNVVPGMVPVLPIATPVVLSPEAAKAAGLLAGKKDLITDQVMALPSDAMAQAKGRMEEMQMDFVTGEGEILGTPMVQAGNTISIDGVGLRWKGSYKVTSATHEIVSGGVYTTYFEIGGSEPNTMANMVEGGRDASQYGRINGVVSAIVTNLMDPLMNARVKVKFPWLDSMVESAWARIASPMAGSNRGFEFIPEVGDEVLVAFEQGDFNRPYILGGLWNLTAPPPLKTVQAVMGGKVVKRMIKTTAGHTITLSDAPGQEMISIVDKTTQNKLEIDSVKNEFNITCFGKTNVVSKQDVTVKSETGKVNIEGQMGIALISKAGNITMECIDFKVDAKGQVAIEGKLTADLKASAITIAAKAALKLEGSIVNANSNGPMMLMGKPVNINPPSLIVLP